MESDSGTGIVAMACSKVDEQQENSKGDVSYCLCYVILQVSFLQ